MMYELIKIVMANGTVIKWTKEQWDNYKYDGNFLIVQKDGACISFYNIDYVISIIVK